MKTTRRSFAMSLSAVAALGSDVGRVLQPASGSEDPLHAQAELVRAEFGQHLTSDEFERIRKDFAESAPFLKTFREVKLANGDEPDFTFAALAKR